MNDKKRKRAEFRNTVFQRDHYSCRKCGFQSTQEKATTEIDAHHIVSRDVAIDGGYVKENGITLCKNCHLKAELNEYGFEAAVFFQLIKGE